jgi:diguanylate cyclase (GGDEF)-like protein/PAS domain S-box-containing protein
MQTGETVEDVQHALEWPDGRRRYISVNGAPLRDESGRVSAAVFLITDITQRHLAEQALLDSETRFRLVAENMSDLVCLHQADGRYIYISPSCTALLGYEPEELIGHTPYELFHPDDREHIHHNVHSPILAGKATTPITYRIRRKQGDYIWVETLTKPIRDAQGQIIQLQTTSRDVTEKVQIQQQLEHDALHDALTQLPNRSQLMSRLELALERVKHHADYSFTLLFWDLDHFKVVNDSLGHFVGDELLIQIAAVFQQAIRSVDLAVRLGGDEFVLLLEDETDAQAAIRVVQRIFAQLRSPFIVEGREVVVSASVGIVQGTAAYQNASELLRDADIAMYRAKARGRGRYEVFNPAMHQEALARLQLEQDLRQGIKQQEFQLCYQPIVSLSTGQVSGFEALIRWHHPQQ